ncbi:MAG: M12 family metallo-peptidase [Actinomycetota bacterium]
MKQERGGALRTRVVATLLISLAAAFPGVASTASAGTKPDAGPYETLIDPGVALREAAGGLVPLTLGGRSYRLIVRPAPWTMTERIVVLGDNGKAAIEKPVGPRAVFVGRVEGFANSSVVLTVTPSGVDGFIDLQRRTFTLEPVRFNNHSADPARVLVGLTAGSAVPIPDALGSQARSGGGRFPLLLGFADSAFHARYGANGWADKVAAIRAEMNSVYIPDMGWGFSSPTTLVCTTAACDASRGAASTDRVTLLYQWALAMKSLRDNQGFQFDAAFLYSGKNFDGTANGRAYNPGRYAVGQFVDEGAYNPSNDHEAGQLMAHELGHLFSAVHDDTSRREPVFICDLGVPILNICLIGHEENIGPQHWTVMCGNCNHQPPDQIWDKDLSSSSENIIRPCHDGSWFGGTYEPTHPQVGESMDMGPDCP